MPQIDVFSGYSFGLIFRGDSYIESGSFPMFSKDAEHLNVPKPLIFYANELKLFESWLHQLYPFVISENLKDQYKVEKQIGQGHFAKVYIAKTLPKSIYFFEHSEVAIKRVKKSTHIK